MFGFKKTKLEITVTDTTAIPATIQDHILEISSKVKLLSDNLDAALSSILGITAGSNGEPLCSGTLPPVKSSLTIVQETNSTLFNCVTKLNRILDDFKVPSIGSVQVAK